MPKTKTKPSPLDVDALLAFHRATFGDARMEDDEDTAPPPAAAGGNDPQDRDGDDLDDNNLGDPGKRALEAERREKRAAQRAARESEARAKELAEKIAERERAEMDDQTRLAAERDDWKKKYEEQAAVAAARELELLRRDVAHDKGLPAGLARRLNGSNREELEADAVQFMGDLPTPLPQTPRAPRPDPSQGSGHEAKGGRPTTVADAMREARAERDRRGGNNH